MSAIPRDIMGRLNWQNSSGAFKSLQVKMGMASGMENLSLAARCQAPSKALLMLIFCQCSLASATAHATPALSYHAYAPFLSKDPPRCGYASSFNSEDFITKWSLTYHKFEESGLPAWSQTRASTRSGYHQAQPCYSRTRLTTWFGMPSTRFAAQALQAPYEIAVMVHESGWAQTILWLLMGCFASASPEQGMLGRS